MGGTQTQTKSWTGNEIRETFLRFFEGKGHRRVRSSSLVPHGDPTLLFTNAGMNQFKDVFLGLEKRDYDKATTAQKCVRAGGKHNDLENVGFTKRHHTFFEMLGNFSFGDYFKEKAIPHAWELVTSPEWFGIAKGKLYVTIFGGADNVGSGVQLGVDRDARKFWLAENVPSERIVAIPGLKENFWAMGDTGPCGPCSEIHYDMGPEASDLGHTDCKFPCDCGRYVEIWNLVFMQYNRYCVVERGGSQHTPEQISAAASKGMSVHDYAQCLDLEPLPKPSIDTGMGLERVAAVLQGVISNYDTDLFVPLMKRAAELCGVDFEQEQKLEAGKGGAASLRVIADHFRAATFLVADGVLPSNEGRGYVLRKILRRAFLHARHLRSGMFTKVWPMAEAVREVMGGPYPELIAAAQITDQILKSEEERFHRIAAFGLKHLEDDLPPVEGEAGWARDVAEKIDVEGKGAWARGPARKVDAQLRAYEGQRAFRIYETYGLPLDLIEDALRDRGIEFDRPGFDKAMEEQRKRARASWKGGAKEAANPAYAKIADRFTTEPDFYFATSAQDCCIEALPRKTRYAYAIASPSRPTPTAERASCAITPARTSFMPPCAMSWART